MVANVKGDMVEQVGTRELDREIVDANHTKEKEQQTILLLLYYPT